MLSPFVLWFGPSIFFVFFSFFFQAEDGIRDVAVTGVQTCALPIWLLGEISLSLLCLHSSRGSALDLDPPLHVGGLRASVLRSHRTG